MFTNMTIVNLLYHLKDLSVWTKPISYRYANGNINGEVCPPSITFVRGGRRGTMAKEDSMKNFLFLKQEMYVNIKLVMV